MHDLDANKRVVSRFFAAIANRNEAILDSLMTEDCTYWLIGEGPVGGTKNRHSFKSSVKEILWEGMEGPPTVNIETLTAEEDRVSVLASGDMKLKNGKEYKNVYHILIWLRDGKICHAREFFDTAYLNKVFFQ